MSDHLVKEFMRVFCAVELPVDVRAYAAAHITRLHEANASRVKASWEREEKLHLTLKFLGEIGLPKLEAVKRATMRAAESVEQFKVSLQDTGAFPARGNPRVLWLGLQDDTGRLAQLQGQLEAECARESFPREERAFHPHLTIARIRIPNAAARRLANLHTETEFEPVRFTVKEIVIMRSELGAGGSRYVPLSRHELQAKCAG